METLDVYVHTVLNLTLSMKARAGGQDPLAGVQDSHLARGGGQGN